MTQKRPPKWQRHGYQNEAEYRAACSAARKTERAAMAASKATHAASRVLQIMWRAADFDKTIVTITKQQIMQKAPCSLDTVKRALKSLREEGSIVPQRNWQGGSGVPTTWQLRVAGQRSTPSDEQVKAMEAKREREAAWNFLRAKYGPLRALEMLGDPEDEN